MDTYFASPERATPGELYREVHAASSNPIISGIMKTVSGILAVLNEHRQILAVNEEMLKMLGVDEAEKLLGLRPGEAIKCIHANEMPAGCGTSRYCSTCGAAIAIATSLGLNEPVEKKCVATVEKNGVTADICLRVRSCPISFDGARFLLLFIQDITQNERWRSLERTFFQDIGDLITSLRGTGDLLELRDEQGKSELTKQIQQMSQRLAKEIEIQRTLSTDNIGSYTLERMDITTDSILREIQIVFTGHHSAKNRMLAVPENPSCVTFNSDPHLVLRVLTNMLINAFEATGEGGTVKLWSEASKDHLSFCVWNSGAISDDISGRIFQRYFSTKSDQGRGIGTYAMKLFGEHILGGSVSFTTSQQEGTTFRLSLPL